MAGRVSRPIALVTGGAKRVGRTTALALARAGCDVALTYKTSAEEAERTSGEIDQAGGRCWVLPLDLGDSNAASAFADDLPTALSAIDVLVHNASIYSGEPIGEIGPDRALEHYTVNALAPLLLTQALLPRLRASTLKGGASIVAMLDIHAMGLPRRGFAPYAMSKAALHEMVRSLAAELAPNIRVNGVAPGVVAWPDSGYESDAEAQRAYLSRVPLARAGTPEDASEAVRWLALDATYTTGQVIRVDGGRSLR